MDELINYPGDEQPEVYPEYVLKGVRDSLKQAQEGKLTPFTSVKDMLNLQQSKNSNQRPQ